MENRIEKALDYHQKGYNCSQAVICAYCDLFGIDEETAFRMSEGFGAGMGNTQNTCGAVSAMFMLAGLKTSSGGVEKGVTKAKTYKQVSMLSKEFETMNTTTICKELKGLNGTSMKRSCKGCIEDASKLIEKYLLNN